MFTYESILLFLVLYRSTIIYKETGRRFKSTELVAVLIKDQILYFIAYVPLFSTFFFRYNNLIRKYINMLIPSLRVMVPAIAGIIDIWLSPTEDDAMIVVMNILGSPSIP